MVQQIITPTVYQQVLFASDHADSEAQPLVGLSPPQQLDGREGVDLEPAFELAGRGVGAVHLGKGHAVATQRNRNLAVHLHSMHPYLSARGEGATCHHAIH